MTTHEVKFERNTRTGQWRATCTCLWTHIGPQWECQAMAATHDIEWVEEKPAKDS